MTVTRFGRLDILVTSSAYNYTRAIVDTTEDEIDAVIRTNARGPLLAARAASRAFGPEGGRIVTLSATAARRGRPHRSVYAATKGAVEAMSRVLCLGNFLGWLVPAHDGTPRAPRGGGHRRAVPGE